jgi:CMP/dCMP kinase
MIIAIDGPSGAGKSTIAKIVAKKVGFSCLDTGAMFRSVAVLAQEQGVSLDNDAALGALAQQNEISFTFDSDEAKTQHVFIAGKEVTTAIRTAEIDKAVSPVSAAPSVRAALLDQQRRIGNAGNYVVEGRDIGTTVFPQAEVKIFLTASAEERARRRVEQNKERGVGLVDYEEVLADIIRRDKADSTRAVSPLRQAEDAYLLDSSDLTIDQVVDIICQRVQKAMQA